MYLVNGTNTSAPIGSNVTLVCQIIGFPIPTVDWLINNTSIDIDSYKTDIVERNISNTGLISLLTITELDFTDINTYTCNGSNSLVETIYDYASLELTITR